MTGNDRHLFWIISDKITYSNKLRDGQNEAVKWRLRSKHSTESAKHDTRTKEILYAKTLTKNHVPHRPWWYLGAFYQSGILFPSFFSFLMAMGLFSLVQPIVWSHFLRGYFKRRDKHSKSLLWKKTETQSNSNKNTSYLFQSLSLSFNGCLLCQVK